MCFPPKPLVGLKLLFSVILLILAGNASSQLQINLNFDDFLAGPSGDVNAILNGATYQEAMDAMEYAAAVWEDVFANSSSSLSWSNNGVLVRDIDISWNDIGGSTLARGGLSFSGSQWAGNGFVRWDGDGSSSFFVDTTPNDNAEWGQFSERSQNLGGVDVNIERISYDAPPGVARDNTDFLAVAIHEFTHTLGMVDGFAPFRGSDISNDGDIDITSGPFVGAEIDIRPNDAHTNFSIPSPGNNALGDGRSDYPYEFGGNQFFLNSDYNPANMAPSTSRGVRKGITEADILIVAQFLQFDMDTVNFDPNPTLLVLGDLNGDGSLTDTDISAFVQALTDPTGYAAAYPGLDPNTLGDFSGDGVLTNGDIGGFVNAVGSSASSLVPEPTSLALLFAAGLLTVRRRR